ncbi:uncharacterized protein LOC116169047 [Photinus pyralis]|uniref:uncharacterized protein LOC116169047 n=1 Tax=Photinus pyralis TaxID=7054 RepID=UPI001266F4B8|nr:uncharacterized protein LOC116169047 [Photinus pyralis]
MHYSVLLLVFVTNTVSAYYNNHATTKSYELEVPGSNPIRIIETDPLWNRHSSERYVQTFPEPWTDVEHRSVKTHKRPSQLKNEDLMGEDLSKETSKELNQFLKNYAEKLKRTRPIPSAEQNFVSDERLDKIELVTKPEEIPTSRLANLLLVDKNENVSEVKPFSPARDKKHRPTDEKKGWVSLDVVPWSVSKVAKWHSSVMMQEDAPQITTQPNWHHLLNKQTVSYNQPLSIYKAKPFVYDSDLTSHSKPDPQDVMPSEYQMSPEGALVSPMAVDEKFYLKDYIDSIKPPWKNKYHITYGHHGNKDHDCEHGQSPIITDGLPPNFPTYTTNVNRRKGIAVDDEHPLTHPFNGAGEWVLVTTTKGYKPSHDRQRSLDIEAIPEHEGESINTHKSVRLTVLPPLNNSRINMTTSHGGLLQVESTFETVDEAQRMAAKKENIKKGQIKKKPLRKPPRLDVIPSVNVVSTPPPAVVNKPKVPSPSSVLAAVGAGMIPATMAMLVPMAIGRRRKRDVLFQRKHIPLHYL